MKSLADFRAGGFAAFFKKELREIRHTWRLWVVPGIFVFVGLTTPILTALTPALLRATAKATPGVVITFPPAIARDSYLQFAGNLQQMVLIALVITGAALIAGERRSGTIALVLTKPVSRTAFVIAKAASELALLASATVVGTVICIVGTVAIFDSSLIGTFIGSVALWFVFAAMLIALMLVLSTVFDGQAPAAGTGIGVFIAFSVLPGFPLIRDHSPAGLLTASARLLKHESAALAWPLVTTIVLTAVLLARAVWRFRSREL
jgi:ABC-2 type transport system permease protein